ncbi:MAG: UDP-N-acetylglucosamine 1-carboxyvinyltransferase [Nitrospirae bacterium]|nr:MAG: UDP-N-acetylglucosamine 1-carboxyvinyltransferase [Nitrospirota bacterium]
MQKFRIIGGARLNGRVRVSGAKNAALPLMAATLLSPAPHTLREVPTLRDIYTMAELLNRLGADCNLSANTLSLNTERVSSFEAPYELVRTMRASVLVLGPLVARYGKARVSLPGGCAIGARPINLHLMALEKMGAEINLEQGYIVARAKRLKGTRVYFDVPTVTGTENIMMAATLARGTTIIENAAREPEVVDLAKALKQMGAQISGEGESVITIEGVKELNSMNHTVIPDRIEASTFITAAAITSGEITIENVVPEHIDSVMEKLEQTGTKIKRMKGALKVKGPERPEPASVKTMPYPGFPTDMQAQFMALMTVSSGTSIITETIFENRFMHVAELRRFGAEISIEGHTATVTGVEKLRGAPVMATDLRASASLVLAALRAEGESIIDRIYHIDRGYETIEKKLRALGAQIERFRE